MDLSSEIPTTTRTTLRLQLSASGSNKKLDSFVKDTSKMNMNDMIDNTANHWSHAVPPVPGWYEAKANSIRTRRMIT
jgi:hypothetical protein